MLHFSPKWFNSKNAFKSGGWSHFQSSRAATSLGEYPLQNPLNTSGTYQHILNIYWNIYFFCGYMRQYCVYYHPLTCFKVSDNTLLDAIHGTYHCYYDSLKSRTCNIQLLCLMCSSNCSALAPNLRWCFWNPFVVYPNLVLCFIYRVAPRLMIEARRRKGTIIG